MNTKKSMQKRAGFAMAMALIVLVVLLVAGTGLLSIGMHNRVFAVRTSADIKARCAADAGLTKACSEARNIMNIAAATNGSNLPYAHSEQLPYGDANFKYKISADSNGVYQIVSTGYSGGAHRTVTASLRLRGLFDFAILTKGVLGLKSGTTVDWYNYDPSLGSLKIGTNSTTAGAITAGTGVTINGDVLVGPGGDPDEVVNSRDLATITGDVYAMAAEQEFPSVTVPSSVLSLPSGGSIGNSITLSGGSVKYDSIYIGQGDEITIDGPVTLYVTGDMSLGNSSQLNIVDTNPNASLTLYVGGGFWTKNGGMINNLTQDPTKLKIYALDSCTQMGFATAGTLYGAIYAPNAEVSMKSSVDLCGAIMADKFYQGASANVYYDPALRKVDSSDAGTSLVMHQWSEQ